ncbi:MAG: hypothetical protein LC802_02595 [Acidobacteria bacterium]|nr:hypothetical protein [Acidobacteriota bacterium]
MSKVRAYGIAILLTHGLILLLHDIAHRDLQIFLPPLKYVYAYAVIVFAPLLATILLWTRWQRAGAWVFLLSMMGSLLFGAYHHFVLISDDHVCYAPEGMWLWGFKATAVLLAVVEGAGCWFGVWALGRAREAEAFR